MTLPRVVGIVLILSAISLGVVWQRVQRARTAYEIHQLTREEIKLMRAIDEAKATIARLRAPDRVRERVNEMQLSVLPPEWKYASDTGDRWAIRRSAGPHRQW